MLGRGVATVLLALLLSGPIRPAFADASPAYLLSPDEIAPLRAREGKSTHEAVRGKVAVPLLRVIKNIAANRGGRYSGNNWSVFEHFDQFINGPPDEIAIEQGRFLIGSGCRPHSCGEKASFIVDMQSGHVAFALVHYFTVDKRWLRDRPALTQFMKTCVNPELRDFARVHFTSWVKFELARHKSDIETLNTDESKTLTTRC